MTDTERLLEELALRLNADTNVMIRLAQRAVARSAAEASRPRELVNLLIARGDAHTWKTVSRIGAVLRSSELRSFTGLTCRQIRKARTNGQLWGFRLPEQTEHLFPVLQFEGSKVRNWVPALLAATGTGASALHFLTARRGSLGGSSYGEELIKHNSSKRLVATMLAQAQRIGDPAA